MIVNYEDELVKIIQALAKDCNKTADENESYLNNIIDRYSDNQLKSISAILMHIVGRVNCRLTEIKIGHNNEL